MISIYRTRLIVVLFFKIKYIWLKYIMRNITKLKVLVGMLMILGMMIAALFYILDLLDYLVYVAGALLSIYLFFKAYLYDSDSSFTHGLLVFFLSLGSVINYIFGWVWQIYILILLIAIILSNFFSLLVYHSEINKNLYNITFVATSFYIIYLFTLISIYISIAISLLYAIIFLRKKFYRRKSKKDVQGKQK